MDVTISHPHVEVPVKLQHLTNEKLNTLKDNYGFITGIEVIFDEQKHLKLAKANVHIPGKIIHAESESDIDFHSAVDLLIDKLDNQLRKHKEKSKNHRD